jgi:hypothetical protein
MAEAALTTAAMIETTMIFAILKQTKFTQDEVLFLASLGGSCSFVLCALGSISEHHVWYCFAKRLGASSIHVKNVKREEREGKREEGRGEKR